MSSKPYSTSGAAVWLNSQAPAVRMMSLAQWFLISLPIVDS